MRQPRGRAQDVDSGLLLKDAAKLLPNSSRRLFLRNVTSLGALTLLTGCDIIDGPTSERALRVVSQFNDWVQARLFNPNRLAETFPTDEQIEKSESPDLWPLFDALRAFPVMVLRAENSDLLSEATVAEMKRRHPRLAARTIKNRGHVPFLDEPESLAAIARWLARVDAKSS